MKVLILLNLAAASLLAASVVGWIFAIPQLSLVLIGAMVALL